MIGFYYTTVISAVFAVVALAFAIAAAVVAVRVPSDRYWSRRKMVAFWSLVGLTLAGVVASIIPAVTAMDEARKSERGLGDGPRFNSQEIDGRPVDGIVEMADNFPNVATKCVWSGWRAFVTSNGDHLAVVRDESCEYVETGPS